MRTYPRTNTTPENGDTATNRTDQPSSSTTPRNRSTKDADYPYQQGLSATDLPPHPARACRPPLANPGQRSC